MSANRTEADKLLELASVLLMHGGRAKLLMVELNGDDQRGVCSLSATALRLRSRPALALRAQVEEWDLQRIIRELY